MLTASLCTQLKIMLKRKEFKCAMLIMLAYACAAFLFVLKGYWGMDISLIKDANQAVCFSRQSNLWSFFSYMYPFLVVLPFSTAYIDDYNNQFLPVYFSRSSRRSYYISKLLAGFIGTALVIAIPCFINLILCNIFLPHNDNTWLGEYQMENFYRQLLGTNLLYDRTPLAHAEMPFLKIYLLSPFLYNVVFLIIFSVFSGFLGAFILSLSFGFKKYKIVLFIPLFVLLELSRVFDGHMLSSAMEKGIFYSNYNILDYVVPTFFKGQNFLFFGGVILVMAGIIICFTVYGIKNDIKSIQ